MRLIRGEGRRGPVVSSAITLSALAVLVSAEVSGRNLRELVPILALVVTAAVGYRTLLAWRAQVGLIVLVIFFVPIKRYILPGSLPFNLEPYRLLVMLICVFWATSLLIDPRVRLRRSGFDGPVLVYFLCIFLSLLANPHRTAELSTDVTKTLLFFASFFLVYFFIASVLRDRRDIDFVVRAIVGAGTAVALLAIIESRTHYNVFDHLQSVLPFLRFTGSLALDRGGRLRVVGSAQHPIALGAAFAMVVPFAVYLAQGTRRHRWWLAVFVLLLGALATSSRTAITMLAAIALVYVASRGREVRKLWPLVVPALAVVHLAIPGAIGTTWAAFFPRGGLIAEQKNAGEGHARLSTLGPALRNEVATDPLFGEGFATRVVLPSPSTPVPNAPVLDDQWLGVLCETGAAGVLSLGWLFVSFLRRMRRAARGDDSARAWLLIGAAASTTGYAIGMFTFDAFGFIQVTFLLFIALGVGAAALRAAPGQWDESADAVLAMRPRRSPSGYRPHGAAPAYFSRLPES
jgi:hypothetical protein